MKTNADTERVFARAKEFNYSFVRVSFKNALPSFFFWSNHPEESSDTFNFRKGENEVM